MKLTNCSLNLNKRWLCFIPLQNDAIDRAALAQNSDSEIEQIKASARIRKVKEKDDEGYDDVLLYFSEATYKPQDVSFG